MIENILSGLNRISKIKNQNCQNINTENKYSNRIDFYEIKTKIGVSVPGNIDVIVSSKKELCPIIMWSKIGGYAPGVINNNHKIFFDLSESDFMTFKTHYKFSTEDIALAIEALYSVCVKDNNMGIDIYASSFDEHSKECYWCDFRY